MTVFVQHSYEIGQPWSTYWVERNVAVHPSKPESYWTRIDQTLGLPALEFRYAPTDPNTPGDYTATHRNQLANPKGPGGGTVTLSNGQTYWLGFRMRFGAGSYFGSSFNSQFVHSSWTASVSSGPTAGFHANGAPSQTLTVVYNRGAGYRVIGSMEEFVNNWMDVLWEYRVATSPNGYLRVWTKPMQTLAFPATPVVNVSGLDSYGSSQYLNRLSLGIYEFANAPGNYMPYATNKLAIASTRAEIESFLGAVTGLPGAPVNLRSAITFQET